MYKKGLRRLLRTASSYSLMAILSLQMVSNSTIVVQAKTQNPVEQSVQEDAAIQLAGDNESKLNDFDIQDGVLMSYKGTSTSIHIPDGVTKVATGALTNIECSEVYLPVGLEEIEVDAIKLAPAAKIVLPSGWEGGLKTYASNAQYSFISADGRAGGATLIVPDDIVSIDGKNNLNGGFAPATQIVIQSNDTDYSYKNTSWYKQINSNYRDAAIVDEREFDKNGFAIRDGELVAYNGTGGDLVIPDSVTSIRSHLFQGMDIFDSITVGDSVKELGYGCFSEMRNRLKKVTIGDGVTKISENCFSVDFSLEEVVLGKNVKTIGNSAFFNTRSLTNFVLPESVEFVDSYAFFGSAAGASIDYSHVKVLSQPATMYEPIHFDKVDLSSLEEFTSSGCFYGSNIGYLIIGPNLKEIQQESFGGGKVGYIKWPENGALEKIGGSAFNKTPSSILNDNPIPDSVTYVGARAFGDVKPCDYLRLPLNLEEMYDRAVTLSKDALIELPRGWKGNSVITDNALMTKGDADDNVTLVIPSDAQEIEDYFLNASYIKRYVIRCMPNESDAYKNTQWYQKLVAADIEPEVEVWSEASFKAKRIDDTNQFAYEYKIDRADEQAQTITFTIPDELSLVANSQENDMSATMTVKGKTITVKLAANKTGSIRFVLEQNALLAEESTLEVKATCADAKPLGAKVRGLYADYDYFAVGDIVYFDINGSIAEQINLHLNDKTFPVQLNALGEGYAKLPLKDDKTTLKLSLAGMTSDKVGTVDKQDIIQAEVTKLTFANQIYGFGGVSDYDITESGKRVVCVPSKLFTFEIEATGLDKLEGNGLVLVNGDVKLPIEKKGDKYYAQGYIESPKQELRIECGDESIFRTIVKWIIDPSGYVYEAVESERIEGATATIYYSPSPSGEGAVKWDAADCGQENDLVTGEDGYFAWDVPEGYYQIVVKKDGYKTAKSDWLPVPPPQLDVNFNLMNENDPKIKCIVLEDDHLNIYFDQYMKKPAVTNINAYEILGEETEVTIAEIKPLGNYTEDYAKGVSLIFEEPIEAEDDMEEFTLDVRYTLSSYADKYFSSTKINGLHLSKEINKMEIDNGAVVGKEHMIEMTATVLPKEAAAGKEVTVTTTNEDIAQVMSVSKVDENGQVTIILAGVGYGQTTLNLEVEDSIVTESIPVVVPINNQVKKAAIKKLDVKNPPVEKNLDGSEIPDEPKKEDSKIDDSKKEDSKVDEPKKEDSNSNSSPVAETITKGKVVTYKNAQYKVINARTDGKGTVAFKSASKKTVTSVTIPKTIKINGYTYKVSQIENNAFKGYKKLKKVTIGANVTKIGKNAFNGCKNLKTIKVNTKSLKSVGKNALKGVNAKCKIRVPKKKLNAYKKLFKGKGKKVKVSA